MKHALGIDIGSTTVKVTVIDESHAILFSDYKRHFANIKGTLQTLLSEARAKLGNLTIHPTVTGSGGMSISEYLHIPFCQEVVCVANALQDYEPKTDVAIELGGEDAKIIYFNNGIEQRMNGVCAGGTGSFIDQMASLLQTDATGLNEYARNYDTLYPIAARCGVFAKSDIQPLINEGATKENLAASIFQAVVNQTISGLACGKPIKGYVAFLGGPLHFMPELKNAQTWLDKGCSIANAEVKNQFMADGWHKEMSLHYHISAVADFYETIRLIQANKLTSKLDPEFNEYLRSAAEVLIHFTYPNYFEKGSDYIVPGFNDSWKSNWSRSTISKNFIKYTELFPDSEEFKYMATAVNGGNAQGKTPGNDIKVFGDAGYYVMRNGWEPSSTVMIFSNNKSNDISTDLERWSHNQPDNGTFELYINKRNFFPDSGVYSYEYNTNTDSGKARLWFRNSENHNTLTLGKVTEGNRYASDFKYAAGKLLKADADVLVFENQGYDNLKHRRTVFYVDKSYFVLVDEGIGEATGDLHLNFNLCENKDNVVLDVEQKGAHTSFADNNNIVIRTFAEDNNSITCQEKEGRFSFSSSANDGYKERIAYSIDMNKADNKTARFATVILPIEKYTEEKEISVTFGECTNNSISVNVTVAGETKTLSYTL